MLKGLSIGSSSRSKFAIFREKFSGDIFLRCHEINFLLETNFPKSKPPSFKRVTAFVMVFTAVCGSSKESK